MREHMLRSTESPPSHMGAMCSPVGVDKGEGEWAGVSLWRSQGHNREKATQCSWFGIGSSGGGGMRSGAALMSACVWGASGARRPPAFCGAGCGERREARAPPRPPPRDDDAGVDGTSIISTPASRLPRTTSTRRTPRTLPKRPTRGREVFWFVVVCSDTQPASKRASAARLPARGGGARSATAIASPPREGGSARCGATRVRVLKTDLRNQG